MIGRMVFLEGIKSGKGGEFVTKKSLEKEIVATYNFITKAYGCEYTTCQIKDRHVYDESKLPKELVMEKVSYIPALHLIFLKNEEKAVEIPLNSE